MRTASGRRWTRSRTASGSRAWSATGEATGRSGLRPAHADRRPRGRAPAPGRARDPRSRRRHRAGLAPRADDIERGCGGTLLRLAADVEELELTWVVLSAAGARREEAEAGARAFG